ncbi:MAG: hypothetical protein JW741_06610 [Sedimentisphaerales bacterium]|nr:hypothetical protein [Sedimentisphaerales bacterium]
MLSVLSVGAGCAHQKAYKRGAKLSEEGQYERAIEKLEEAVALAEKGHKKKAAQRYREKLEAVKKESAPYFYQQAEDCFARADLGAARMQIERCIAYCPEEPSYQAFRLRLEQAIADAEELRAEALSLAEQRQWPAALERMGEALGLYRTLPGGEGDLKRIKERAYQYHLARAQDRLRDNDLEAAQAEAQTALGYRSDGRDAQSIVRTVTNRREAAGLIVRGKALLTDGDCEEALRVLERAHQLHPEHSELPDLLGRARRAVCDRWIAQGRGEMDAGQHVAALGLFRRSHGLLKGYGGVDGLMAEARARLAAGHLEASREHLSLGISGCAVLHAAAALGYQPNDFEARRLLGQCAGQVRQDVGYRIEFAGFEAAPEHRTIAEALGSATLEHLTRVRPANVMLVEPAPPQATADSQNPTPEDRADAVFIGQVLESRVIQETKQTGEGQSTYQDGFRAEPNPDYVQAAAEVDAALADLERSRLRLGEAEARLARYEHADPDDATAQARKRQARAEVAEWRQRLVNAATDVGVTELHLAATPQEVLVPNMVQHTYPIQTVTWTARVHCMLKMTDAATGELMLAEGFEVSHERSDHFVAADPARNVPEDPLEMPDDATLIQEAVKSLAGKLKRPLEAVCKKHGHRFVVRMQRAQDAGAAGEAVDNAVKYLFAYPAGYEQTDKMVRFLRSYLGAEDELIDVRKPLREHCQLRIK